MNIQFTGTITEIKPAKSFDSGSKSREFWAKELPNPENEHDYPQELPFDIFSSSKAKTDMTAALDDIPVGSVVSFNASLRGNRWTNPKNGDVRIFTGLRVISKIEVKEKASAAPEPATPDFGEGDPDDMPF